MPRYDDGNRAFLQAFMSRGSLTFENAKPIIAAILAAKTPDERRIRADDVQQETFNEFIRAADDAIHHLDMGISNMKSQNDQTRLYALVNRVSDPITQLASVHSVDELAFLKRILDAMFVTYNVGSHEVMAITSLQALQYTSPPAQSNLQNGTGGQGSAGGSLTKSQAEKFLNSLVEAGWFEKSAAGYHSLSLRSLIELGQWLVETYDAPEEAEDEDELQKRIKFCHGCKAILTEGQRCAKTECTCRIHERCIEGVFRQQRGANNCPVCNTEWTGRDYVGEKAARPSNSGRRSAKLRSSNTADSSRRSGAVAEDGRDSDQPNGTPDQDEPGD